MQVKTLTTDTTTRERLARLSTLAISVDELFIDKAQRLLDVFVSDPTDVLSLGLVAEPGKYEKRFLFGDGMTSAWAFAWGAGASTPIHDHHCPCVVGVVDGTVLEEWFEPEDEGSEFVRLAKAHDRPRGAITALRPRRPNIHRIRNIGSDMAMTVHIYGFNHKAVATSVDREYLARELS